MKRLIKASSVGSLIFGMLVTLSFAQTATDILEKFIETSGGRKLLGSIKDTTMTGTLDIVMSGMSGSLTMYLKEPNKLRMDMEIIGMVITQAYDGDVAWWTNPQTGATEEMPEDQADNLKRQAYGNDILLNPDKHGVSYTLKKSENIEGKDYFVLEQSYPDGFALTMYIDSKTYLPYKTVSMVNQMGVEAEAEAETFLSDWRKVNGMMVNFSFTIFYDGEEAVSMNFSEVKYNTGLDDSLFKMEK